jgi:hypothetical protein
MCFLTGLGGFFFGFDQGVSGGMVSVPMRSAFLFPERYFF